MTTHRQKSFIAIVSAQSGTLGHLNQLHSENLLDPFQGFSWSSFSPASASHILSHVSDHRNIGELRWYFRSTDSGYLIFIRSKTFFRRAISQGRGYFGAVSVDGEGLSTFRLAPVAGDEHREGEEIDEGDEVMTQLVSLNTGKALCLREADFKYRAGKSWRQKRCRFIAADGGQPLNLRLKIIQVDAPYLGHPGEV